MPRSVPELLGEQFAVTREWALHRLDEPLVGGEDEVLQLLGGAAHSNLASSV
ncbi:hypothetical protein [Streptomyces sp. NPDC059928]|uniref:hypothetical protein n=1 Tax=unclassified Streptomyces TaxID=2593676 RepID=UPI003648A266